MANEALHIIQYGKESTRGTAVAATRKLMAEKKAVPVDRKPTFVEDALGVRARATRMRDDVRLVKDTLVVPHAYYQCLPMFFSCGLKGNITPTETTPAQADYLWTFLPSMTGNNSPDTITLEIGDEVQAYEQEYLMFESIKIGGQVPQDAGEAPVKIEGAYFARQNTRTTATAAIAIPTMTSVNAKLVKFYKDTAWSGRGVSEITQVLRDYEVEIMTGNHPKMLGSGQRYFDTHGEGFIGCMMTLTLEGTAAVNSTLYTDFEANTPYAYSLQFTGPQIGSGTNHSLIVNAWMGIESIEPLSQRVNGNNLTKVLLHSLYDTTGANTLEVKVTTNQNTI